VPNAQILKLTGIALLINCVNGIHIDVNQAATEAVTPQVKWFETRKYQLLLEVLVLARANGAIKEPKLQRN
jgi:hypothetical protein